MQFNATSVSFAYYGSTSLIDSGSSSLSDTGGTIWIRNYHPLTGTGGTITWSGFGSGTLGTATIDYTLALQNAVAGYQFVRVSDATHTVSAGISTSSGGAHSIDVSGWDLSTFAVELIIQAVGGGGGTYSPVLEVALSLLAVDNSSSSRTSETTVIPHGVNCHNYDNGGYFAPTFPPGHGLLLGDLTNARNWARANGIHAALVQDTQVPAIQLLEQLGKINDSAWVYTGDTLDLIPWDEVSKMGNGARFDALTASGPIIDIADTDYADGGSPVKVERDSHINCDNVVAVEYKNRTIDYTTSTVSASDQMSIALYGTRKGGTLDSSPVGVGVAKGAQSFSAIHDPLVAQAIASLLVKKSAADVNVYKFTLKAEKFYLIAMSFITISDGPLGLNKFPVRLLSANETPERTIECVGEEFVYGLHHPDVKSPIQSTGTLSTNNVDPGLVNAPLVFEPTQAMIGSNNPAQLWFAVSGSDPNYGGCIAFVSIDGGLSYGTSLGRISPGTMGTLTADYPVGSDPDTSHTLSVDLSESNGELAGQSQATADAFLDECYVGVNSSPVTAAYEVVCPTAATVTSLHEYDLATYIRRGAGGTTIVDHPAGSLFAVLNGSVLKIDIDPIWYGKTLYFKFAAINLQGGQQNSLADCTPYAYTITGNGAIPTFLVNGVAP